jgi:hypothetical protein
LGLAHIFPNMLRNIPVLPGERNFQEYAVTGVIMGTPDLHQTLSHVNKPCPGHSSHVSIGYVQPMHTPSIGSSHRRLPSCSPTPPVHGSRSADLARVDTKSDREACALTCRKGVRYADTRHGGDRDGEISRKYSVVASEIWRK